MSEAKPGPELDALVAEKVMGCSALVRRSWNWKTTGGDVDEGSGVEFSCRCPGNHNGPGVVGIKQYSTSIAHAWEVVERSVKLGWAPVAGKDNPDEPVWYAEFMRGEGEDTVCHCSYAPTAPHAICLAALKAAGE